MAPARYRDGRYDLANLTGLAITLSTRRFRAGRASAVGGDAGQPFLWGGARVLELPAPPCAFSEPWSARLPTNFRCYEYNGQSREQHAGLGERAPLPVDRTDRKTGQTNPCSNERTCIRGHGPSGAFDDCYSHLVRR